MTYHKIDVLLAKKEFRDKSEKWTIGVYYKHLKLLKVFTSFLPTLYTEFTQAAFHKFPKYSKTKKAKKRDNVFGDNFEIECHILDTGRSQAKSMHEKSIFLLTMFWVPCYHIYLLYVMVVADFKVKKTHFLPIPLKSRICVPNT